MFIKLGNVFDAINDNDILDEINFVFHKQFPELSFLYCGAVKSNLMIFFCTNNIEKFFVLHRMKEIQLFLLDKFPAYNKIIIKTSRINLV